MLSEVSITCGLGLGLHELFPGPVLLVLDFTPTHRRRPRLRFYMSAYEIPINAMHISTHTHAIIDRAIIKLVMYIK